MSYIYREIKSTLTDSGMDDGEAKAVALMLMEETRGWNTAEALMKEGEDDELMSLTKRIADGEPIQYVLNKAYFCNLEFNVRRGVLIPRPETEEIVKHMISDIKGTEGRINILDIGTGSGCIAVSLAKAIGNAKVEAWDISEDALLIAKENAAKHDADVRFAKVDILNHDFTASQQQYSIIVSNPPYICKEEADDMDANVLEHEPHLALFVPNDDPLLFYRKIAEAGLHILYNKGALYFEINRRFGKETVNMLAQLGYENIELHTDLYGNDRMVKAIKH